MGYSKEQREANAKKKAEQIALQDQNTSNTNDVNQDNIIKVRKEKRNLPLNTMVEVKNGYHGILVYKSPKTIGLTIRFEKFGDTEYFELGELVSAKNTYRKYFEYNWFLIDDQEIIEFLGVQKYYENAFNTENFDKIFDSTPDEISGIVNRMSKGQRNTLIYRAKEFIDNGTIDSRKTIEALEKSLNVELIER